MKLVLALVTLSVVLSTTYGLKCYVCTGTGDCGDEFDKSSGGKGEPFLEECGGLNFCMKFKAGINGIATSITRACINTCTEDTGPLSVTKTTCCQTDGCNSGTALYASLVFILVTAMASWWMK